MKSNGRHNNGGVKIVHIETQFVETDPVNFRAVVQRLTGKDASTVWVGNGNGSSSSVEEAATTGFEAKGGNNNNAYAHGDVVMVKPEGILKDEIYYDDVLSPMKLNSFPFKDLDRLLFEFPLMEELPWW